VTVLTMAALVVVGFFAYQASAAPDRPLAGPPPATETPPAEEPGADADGTEEPATDEPPALPAESGEGPRVVYALGEQRVWLVRPGEDGLGDEVLTTYPVYRSSVDPQPGAYTVSSRSAQLTGSDGVPIEHVVVFAAEEGVVFGFSTATDGSVPDPAAGRRTGGVRQAAADGESMWQFAAIGTPVVVVP
jgi:hypothetical protein